MIDEVLRALVTAAKLAARRPLRTAAPLVVLAVGVAAAATAAVVMDVVLFKAVPFPAADRLVSVYAARESEQSSLRSDRAWESRAVSWLTVDALQGRQVFESVGPWFRFSALLGRPAVEEIEGWYASDQLLALLGAEAIVGRSFSPEEQSPGSAGSSQVALLTSEAWLRLFGGRPTIIGETITVTLAAGEPEAKVVVGVVSAGLRLRATTPDVILPMGLREPSVHTRRGTVFVVARLAPGAATQAAASAIADIVPATMEDEPPVKGRLTTLRDDLVGGIAPPTWLLVSICLALVAIAATSALTGLLGEARDRQPELALRLAVGATPFQVAGQLSVEYFAKTIVTVALGAVLALLLTKTVIGLIPPTLVGESIRLLDPLVLLSGCAIAGSVILAAGVAPTMAVLRRPAVLIPHGARLVSSRLRHLRWMLTLQLAMSTTLVVCSVLFAESLARLSGQPIGFEPARLAAMTIRVTSFPEVPVEEGQWPLFASWLHTEQLIQGLRAVSGVVQAGGVSAGPLEGNPQVATVRTARDGGREVELYRLGVTESYFATMQIDLVGGRWLDARDRQVGVQQTDIGVLVSRAAAEQLGEGAVVGRQVFDRSTSYVFTVVGVVEDMRYANLDGDYAPTMYLLSPRYDGVETLMVRTVSLPGPLLPELVAAVRALDPSVLVTNAVAMDAVLAEEVAGERFRAASTTGFAVAAVVVTMLGAYAFGLTWLAERKRELALRSALGAQRFDLAKLLLVEAAVIVSGGAALGLVVSAAVAGSLETFLYDMSPWSPGAYLLACGVVSVSTGVALVRPIAQMFRADPASALRC